MRASRRSLSLTVAIALAAGLAGCGGDDDSADGERLTRAEYDLLVKQHAETKALGDGTSEADIKRSRDVSKRQCQELQESGKVLRATAPPCRKALEAGEALLAVVAGDACADDDPACQAREFEGFVSAIESFTTALERNARAVSQIDAEDACRTVLSGGPDLLTNTRALRDTARSARDALKAVDDAGEDATDEALDRANATNERFAKAVDEFARSAEDDDATDPKVCENDVEAS